MTERLLDHFTPEEIRAEIKKACGGDCYAYDFCGTRGQVEECAIFRERLYKLLKR